MLQSHISILFLLIESHEYLPLNKVEFIVWTDINEYDDPLSMTEEEKGIHSIGWSVKCDGF